MHKKTVSPGITSWPGGKVATAVAVCTPLVRLPAVSPSPTYRIRTFMRFKRERSVLPVLCMCFLSVLSPGLKKLSPSGGWLRWGCLFSVILTGGGRAVVWPSGLRASSVGNRLLMQPGLHLWVLMLELLSQAGTPQRPGPDRQTVKREKQKLTTPSYNQVTQCDCKVTKWTEEFFLTAFSQPLQCSYHWMCAGILGGSTCCVHGWCGNQRVGLRLHGGGTGTKGGADRYAGQTLGGVFYCLTSYWRHGK